MKRGDEEWKKVDLSTYIRDAFSPQQLYNRIVRNKGGQAIDVFLYLKEHVRARSVTANTNSIDLEDSFEYLTDYGAVLVTNFHVDDDFVIQMNAASRDLWR
jgi:hypothetical protein